MHRSALWGTHTWGQLYGTDVSQISQIHCEYAIWFYHVYFHLHISKQPFQKMHLHALFIYFYAALNLSNCTADFIGFTQEALGVS